ncbi:MAG: hypothetical protein AB7F94_05730 [Nitrospira sp.]
MIHQFEKTFAEPRDESISILPDVEIELDAPPVRVAPGIYAAECLKITKVERREWRRWYWQFLLRLRGVGPENGVILHAFVNVPRTGKLSAYSKLGRWTRIIAAYTGARANRVSMRSFGQFLFTVKVETVRTANSGKKPFPLPEAAQYEIVSEILDIVGRLTQRAGNQ